MDYDDYLQCMDSDSDDDNRKTGPIIKLIKRLSLFLEDEDGWVIVLPGFKSHLYEYKSDRKPEPTNDRVYGANSEKHDEVVDAMKDMSLKTSAKVKNERRRNPPSQRFRPPRQSVEESNRGPTQGPHKHNSKKQKKISGNENKDAMPITHWHTSRAMPMMPRNDAE